MISNKIKYHSYLAVFITIICSACSSYSPKLAPIVNLEKKNDFQIDAGFNIAPESYYYLNFHYSCAYAITDNYYVQYFGNKFSIDENWNLFANQISSGYKFNLITDLYLDATIGFTHQQILKQNISLLSTKKSINYSGNFKIPYSKINLTYNDKDQLLSLGLKTGIMFPEINDFDEKALLIQPSFTLIPMTTNKRYSFSIIWGRTFMIPINDYKLNFDKWYKFDDNAYFFAISNTFRFNLNGRFRHKKTNKNNR